MCRGTATLLDHLLHCLHVSCRCDELATALRLRLRGLLWDGQLVVFALITVQLQLKELFLENLCRI